MRRLILFICLIIMSGCATRQDLNLLKGQVEMLQTRLSMEEKKLSEKEKLVNQTMKQQGELQNKYSELQNQVFAMQGSIDQVMASAGLTPAGGGETRISKLEKDVQALKEQLQSKAPAITTATSGEKSSYDTGFEKFNAGLYDAAIADFKAFLAQNPDPSQAANAYFYMGEALYGLAKYDDAVLSYDNVIKKYKDSDKVPEALYKQGLSFIKMGDKETGNIILKQLIRDYPKTEPGQKAKKALKNPKA